MKLNLRLPSCQLIASRIWFLFDRPGACMSIQSTEMHMGAMVGHRSLETMRLASRVVQGKWIMIVIDWVQWLFEWVNLISLPALHISDISNKRKFNCHLLNKSNANNNCSWLAHRSKQKVFSTKIDYSNLWRLMSARSTSLRTKRFNNHEKSVKFVKNFWTRK